MFRQNENENIFSSLHILVLLHDDIDLSLWTTPILTSALLYQKQLRFHAEQILASTSPAERGRRQMHIIVIINNLTHAGYFGMVLGHKLRWSVVLLGIAQALMNPCAIIEARLWMYE